MESISKIKQIYRNLFKRSSNAGEAVIKGKASTQVSSSLQQETAQVTSSEVSMAAKYAFEGGQKATPVALKPVEKAPSAALNSSETPAREIKDKSRKS